MSAATDQPPAQDDTTPATEANVDRERDDTDTLVLDYVSPVLVEGAGAEVEWTSARDFDGTADGGNEYSAAYAPTVSYQKVRVSIKHMYA